MNYQVSSSINSFTWKYLATVGALLLAVAYPVRSAAQSTCNNLKPGWTEVFCDEFDEGNLSSLFTGPARRWDSAGGYNNIKAADGGTYDVTEGYWVPYCHQPTKNTSLSASGTLVLTARDDPGYYPIGNSVNVQVTLGSATANVSSTNGLSVGAYVVDAQCAIPDGTTIAAIVSPSQITLSKVATSSPPWDYLTVSDYFTYTGAAIGTKRTFLYGYFEINAKIPNHGMVLWPAFWLWNGLGDLYREIDVFEFGDAELRNKIGMNEHLAQALDGGFIAPDHSIDEDGKIINNYPASYIIDRSQDITNDFHTYALKWTPNSVTWYFDNQQIRTLTGHTPHSDMYLIADMWVYPPSWNHIDPTRWIPPWKNTPINLLPANYEIDYIRAYRSQSNEFMWQWGNGGSGWIAGWHADAATDKYLSGDFAGSGRKQLLAIATNVYGWAGLLKYSSGDWSNVWDNQGSGWIAGWHISPSDNYIVGDFAGLGHDQLLAINDNDGWAVLMHYSGGKWYNIWDNRGTGKINWWNMHPGDEYVAGDFDGDGQDELLAISPNGWAHLMKYSGGAWFTIWSNGGSGWIAGWHIGPGGQFLSGDFEGEGRKELMAMATNASDWAVLMHYSGGKWYNIWDNGGSGKIHWWYMHPGDQYLVGNFDGGKRDQLLAVATNGWSHLMSYSGPDWDTPWSNDGGGTIDLWYMHPSDRYIPGDFNGDGKADLFAIATNGWAHLMERRLP